MVIKKRGAFRNNAQIENGKIVWANIGEGNYGPGNHAIGI